MKLQYLGSKSSRQSYSESRKIQCSVRWERVKSVHSGLRRSIVLVIIRAIEVDMVLKSCVFRFAF